MTANELRERLNSFHMQEFIDKHDLVVFIDKSGEFHYINSVVIETDSNTVELWEETLPVGTT